MSEADAFFASYVVLLALFVALRVRFHLRLRIHRGPLREERLQARYTLLSFLLALSGLGTVAYLAGVAGALEVPLPVWLRALGLPMGLVGCALFGWSHAALGRNWSCRVGLTEGHQLVTEGPYRWVRHPMYTAILAWALGLLLTSANLAAGLGWVLLGLVAASRAGAEEQLMREAFGDAYEAWARRTGRFLPRLAGPQA